MDRRPMHARSDGGRTRTSMLLSGAFVCVVGFLWFATWSAPPRCCGIVEQIVAWAAWLLGVTLVGLVLVEGFEILKLAVHGAFDGNTSAARTARPFVSLHVPIHAEPPALVRRTLLALHALRYDRFEVLVIDNNTSDERLWRPIEQLCEDLGPRFRFYHLPRWPGFKAGALNFALSVTSRDATVVGVIDSDYEVAAEYLERLTGFFSDRRVGFVQTPQDYREWDFCWAGRMFYWEYWQFFAVSMRIRNARNAILLHGTMVLVRKDALAGVGGWSEWCVTEDSELGLRLLAAGYTGVYCGKTYGRGLVPFTFRA